MPKKTSQMCSRTPVFPETAFAGIVSLLENDNPTILYPFIRLYTRNSDFFEDALSYQQTTHKKEISVNEHAVIIPLHFKRIWPLQPGYWDNPTIHFDPIDRSKLFLQAMVYPTFFDVLVTPNHMQKNEERFSIALPVSIIHQDAQISQFMESSDFPVDETAKEAGIYTLDNPVGVNINTGEFLHRIPTIHTAQVH